MANTNSQGTGLSSVVDNGNSISKPSPVIIGDANSVQNQILQAADYYGPMIYQQLGFYSSLELSDDKNLDFIPVSQTKTNTKLFVVGILPPSVVIVDDGTTLDRSASLVNDPSVQRETNGSWQSKGAANASASRKGSSKTANLEALNKSNLGQKYRAAQHSEIRATLLALDRIKKTPPLQLLVNPQTFKLSSEKIISDGGFTREGPIIEHWGDQQDKLEASGKIAAFMAVDANPPAASGPTGGGPGLTRVARNYSASYQNLLSLYLLYRNNGGLYVSGLEGNLMTRLSLVGSIYIYYDSVLYIGSFDNFSITETDTNPYSLEYSFQFTVRSAFMLDSPTENNYQVQKLSQSDPALTSNASQVKNVSPEDTGGGDVAPPQGFTPEQAVEQSRQDSFFAAIAQSQKGGTGINSIDPNVASALSDDEYDLTLLNASSKQRESFKTYFNNLPPGK